MLRARFGIVGMGSSLWCVCEWNALSQTRVLRCTHRTRAEARACVKAGGCNAPRR